MLQNARPDSPALSGITASQHDPREQAALLISRYPALTPLEKAKLVRLYRRLSPVDVALLLSDTELGRNLDQFSMDYRRELRTPFRQYAVLIFIAIMGCGIFVWALLGV